MSCFENLPPLTDEFHITEATPKASQMKRSLLGSGMLVFAWKLIQKRVKGSKRICLFLLQGERRSEGTGEVSHTFRMLSLLNNLLQIPFTTCKRNFQTDY